MFSSTSIKYYFFSVDYFTLWIPDPFYVFWSLLHSLLFYEIIFFV
jgi:hypothetical protein